MTLGTRRVLLPCRAGQPVWHCQYLLESELRDYPERWVAAAFGRPLRFRYAAGCMLAKPNLFLVGPMGSGKTAVGKQLARLLRRAVLRQRPRDRAPHRRRHPLYFRERRRGGIPAAREREAIELLTAMDQIVLATGGGAVLLPENRQHPGRARSRRIPENLRGPAGASE